MIRVVQVPRFRSTLAPPSPSPGSAATPGPNATRSNSRHAARPGGGGDDAAPDPAGPGPELGAGVTQSATGQANMGGLGQSACVPHNFGWELQRQWGPQPTEEGSLARRVWWLRSD